ncbi:MAG: sensor histidine kinase [Spirochaetaceae bacterium]|nr:MAG: sensor histidine kinase [Spirochaetaceae bacterium]
MHSLFRRTFVAFIFSFAVLLVVLGGALIAGYNHSLSTWSARRVAMVESAARRILSGAPSGEQPLPQDVPVFIYDRQGTLVASNRGIGRRREPEHDEQRLPVRSGERLLGYYSVGSAVFRNDAANRALAQSLVRAAVAGALAAFGTAAVAAWAFARSLSSPAARVAEGIDAIAHGSLSSPIPEEGAEEIVRIAHAANTLAARLHDEQSLRTQWARDVTHDLRTPIASMRAQLEAIVDGVYRPDPQRISGTLAELGRVERLIADLDELMRLEEPNVRMNVTRFGARDFALTLEQRFGHQVQSRQIDWRADVDDIALNGDETLLHRALSNVLANAVRHTPAGGRIRLQLRREVSTVAHDGNGDAGRVVVAVTNDGPPIPADELPHLFQRLYRGEYARHSEGAGLGLTIAQRIVLLHNGTIDITSGAADGTTVTVVLPQ